MPDAIVIVDAEGTMVYVNSQAEHLFGYERQELLGHPVEILLPEAHRGTHRSHRINYVVAPRPRPMGAGRELQGLRKDGSVFPVEVSLSPHESEQGPHVISAIRDVSERKKADEIRSRLAAIVESSEDAIISKTLDGIVTSWNRGAERIFGYSADEMIGRPVYVLWPDEQEREALILERLKRGEHIEAFDAVRRRKDGATIHVSVAISPIRDSAGQIIGAARVVRDITRRKRADEERMRLIREKAAQEEANRIKDEFLAILSHELRTPLSAVLGWVQTLRTGRMPPEVVDQAHESIERNVRVQAQLIEDLLDVSRIVSGKMQLEMGLVDMGEVVATAADVVRGAAEVKGVRVETIRPPETMFVQGDRARLQQIVWNLLSNAIKFTPAGGSVTLRIDRLGGAARLVVTDTGQGIDPTFLPQVFERFRQAHSTSNRRHGGLGLGLAIVRSLVELHRGTVEAQSAGPNHGATFTVTLPVVTPPFAFSRSDDATPVRSVLLGIRVLVVDDGDDERMIFQTLLELQGADVRTAASAAEALKLLGEWRPDVIISDIGMPERDGYSLIREIRRLPSERGGRIPALALTAHARDEDRERALAAGFQMYVSKPVDVPVLLRRIALLVRSDDPEPTA